MEKLESKREPLIIGICGKMGSGKNYISEKYVIPILKSEGHNVLEMSLADQIKINVMTKDNINYEELFVNKSTKTRTLLQKEGTENGRDLFGQDIWIKYLDNWISIFSQRGITAFVIADIRFVNEAEWIKSRGGLLIKVVAPNRNEIRLRRESGGDEIVYKRIKMHQSEIEIDKIENSIFDVVLHNDINTEDDIKKLLVNTINKFEKSRKLKCIIQKYGGTSIGTPEKMQHVIKIISNYAQSNKLCVVVSAISSSNKSKGTTSKLLECTRSRDINIIKKILNEIETHHIGFARYINNIELEDTIKSICKNILLLLQAEFIKGEMIIKSRDFILSQGERMSGIILSEYLKYNGMKAEYIDTNTNTKEYNNVEEISRDINWISKLDTDNILVFGGYIGNFRNGIIETVGRGYSDFTAGLISSATDANELQIWKEVDGIFTADPNKILDAKLLPRISKAEISQLTYYGCQAVNPLTIDKVNCPILIKNCLNPDGCGTLIEDETDSCGPVAVTIKENIHVINISSNISNCFGEIFATLKQNKINVDLVSTSQVDISIAIDSTQNYNEFELINELSKYGKVDITRNLCVLSLIGKRMIKSIGIAAKMFKVLARNDINIEMISQGSSEINISCVIKETDSTKALCYVHHSLIK